jgi:hypothetical protein
METLPANSALPLPLDPPFVAVEGVVNIRTIGGYPTSDGFIVKPNLLYRSGELNRITEAGREQLKDLGIKVAFDFRSAREVAMFQSASPDIPGVTFVRPPEIFSDSSFEPSKIVALYVFALTRVLLTYTAGYSLKQYEADELAVRV